MSQLKTLNTRLESLNCPSINNQYSRECIKKIYSINRQFEGNSKAIRRQFEGNSKIPPLYQWCHQILCGVLENLPMVIFALVKSVRIRVRQVGWSKLWTEYGDWPIKRYSLFWLSELVVYSMYQKSILSHFIITSTFSPQAYSLLERYRPGGTKQDVSRCNFSWFIGRPSWIQLN
jgi:hypothetical protein